MDELDEETMEEMRVAEPSGMAHIDKHIQALVLRVKELEAEVLAWKQNDGNARC